MANRYLARMKPGASDGYYAAMSSIVAADAETRSAQITGRYAAMASAVNSISQSVVQGMQAAAAYELQSRKLQMDQEVAHYQIEAAKEGMRLAGLKAESDAVTARLHNQSLQLDINRKETEEAIGPAVYKLTTGMPGIIAEMNQQDPLTAQKTLDAFMATLKKETLDPLELKRPGSTAAFMSNSGVQMQLQGANSVAANKMASENFNGVALMDAKMLLENPNADKNLRLQAALAVVNSPRSARYQSLLDLAQPIVASAEKDPDLALKVKLGKITQTDPDLIKQYEQDVANGVPVVSAMANLVNNKKQKDALVTELIGSKPVESSVPGAGPLSSQATRTLQSVKRAGDSAWGAAAKDLTKPGASLEPTSSKWALQDQGRADANAGVVSGGVRSYYEALVEKLVGAKSADAFAAAKRDLQDFLKNPASRKDIVVSQYMSMRDVAGGRGGTNDPWEMKKLLTKGGVGFIPASLQVADFDSLAVGIGRTVSNFGSVDANDMLRYNLAPSAPKGATSVAELVLKEQNKSFRPVNEIIDAMVRRNWITPVNGYKPAELATAVRANSAQNNRASELPPATGKPPTP